MKIQLFAFMCQSRERKQSHTVYKHLLGISLQVNQILIKKCVEIYVSQEESKVDNRRSLSNCYCVLWSHINFACVQREIKMLKVKIAFIIVINYKMTK